MCADDLGQNIDFRAAIFAFEGGNLPVGIGDTNIVHIDERKPANAGTGERLNNPRTHPADADNADMGARKLFQGIGAIKPREAAEALRSMDAWPCEGEAGEGAVI